MSSTKDLPTPLFAKEGHDTSLWQREDRRDFIIEWLHTYELLSLVITVPRSSRDHKQLVFDRI